MAQATDPKPEFTPASGAGRPVQRHETLLLTDVPEASALMADPAPSFVASHLSSTALAALSQRYEILAEAGHGSMGNVYKARDRETGEVVALKLLKPEIAADQSMIERFKNELLFARKITHKNVCRLYEFNRVNGIAYTSMEFVEGESLRSVLNRFGGLPARKAIDLVGQICSGLKEAHAQGIVHRDLKPENVMIDAQGNVKIMDFGIARSMESMTRLTGSMVGTPAYMAPEQVAGKPVDYRTDIYSLGLIIYEMFTGTPAFQADNAVAVALKQMREAPVPPHEIEPGIPVAIERAILKCLEKESAKRFQSIGELENALRVTGVPPSGPAPASVATNFSTHAMAISQPFYSPPEPAAKRPSPLVWIFLGALLVGGAAAGWRSEQITQAANNLAPPASLPVPKPPDFALDIAPPQQVVASPVPAKTEASAPDEPAARPAPSSAKREPVAVDEPDPRDSAPAKSAPELPAENPAAKAVSQHADLAAAETQSSAIPPAAGGDSQTYLWVGRFERQDPAQNAATKIEGLGLPVTVVPRHNDKGDFFVVVTGPFGAKRIPSVISWLDAQGFHSVRQIPNFASGLRQKQNQNP